MTLADRVYLSSLHFSYCGKRLNSSSALCTILVQIGAMNMSIYRLSLNAIRLWYFWHTFWWFFKMYSSKLWKINKICVKNLIIHLESLKFDTYFAVFGPKLNTVLCTFPPFNLHTYYMSSCFIRKKSHLHFSTEILMEYVNLQSFFTSEISENICKSTFRVTILGQNVIFLYRCKGKARDLAWNFSTLFMLRINIFLWIEGKTWK